MDTDKGHILKKYEFDFPSNVKQIGGIDAEMRIYMEDYVYTFLHDIAKEKDDEQISVLCGKYFLKDNQRVLIISGAIKGKYTKKQKGMEMFTEESWQYIREQMRVNFKDLDLIGICYSQPEYSDYLSNGLMEWHMENFTNPFNVIYVLDILDRSEAFYIYNDKGTGMYAAKGFFVYYDKNEQMQEYMLSEDLKDSLSPLKEKEIIFSRNKAEKPNPKKNSLLLGLKQETKKESLLSDEEIIELTGSKKKKHKDENDLFHVKQSITMVSSLSAILFLISFIMGMTLIQNRDQIVQLEEEIQSLNYTYRNIVAKLSGNDVTAVFATANDTQGEVIEAEYITEVVNKLETVVLSTETKTEPITTTEPVTATEAITATEATTSAPEPINEYVVQEGETLSSISRKFYGNTSKIKEIIAINGLEDADKIIAGKKIKLP